jgi:hypothetical protein
MYLCIWVVNLLLLAPDDDPLRVETCSTIFILIYILSVGVKNGVIVCYHSGLQFSYLSSLVRSLRVQFTHSLYMNYVKEHGQKLPLWQS